MSQFTLTKEEDAIALDALRAKSTQYTAMFGSVDAGLEALIAKIEGQLPAPVVAEPVVVEEVVAPKAKKSKSTEETSEQ